MKDTGEPKPKTAQAEEVESKAANEVESEMEDRDQARVDEERNDAEDLNQGMETGTHDSQKLGVNWPPSYRNLKKRKPAAKPGK